MQRSPELVELGLSVARWGANNALALALSGLVVMVLGRKAFRPVSALVAGAGGAFAASLALSRWLPDPPVSSGLLVALAALGLGVLGLVAPTVGTVAAATCFGWLGGTWAAGQFPAHAELALLVGVLGSFIAASVLAGLLPRFVTAVVGGLAAALGAWAFTGASGWSPALFRLPAIWIALAGVLVVVAAGLEQVRHRAVQAGAARRQGKAEALARRRKAEEDRARYERYMQ